MANAWGANAFSPGNIDTSTGQPIGAPPPVTPTGAPLPPPTAPPPGAPPAAPVGVNLPGLGPVKQNPDGSFTLLSGPNAGSIVEQTPGGIVQRNSDGTGKMLTGPFAGSNLAPSSNGWIDKATGAVLAPAVGGVTAVADTASGHLDKVPGDIAYGATGGIVGNGPGSPTTGIINPKSIDLAGTAIGKDVNNAGGDIKTAADAAGNAISGIGGGGSGGAPDGSDADAETTRANALADALGGQAGAAGAQADTDRGLGTQTRQQQEDSIAGLTAAANGTAPSAAELQLKKQAGIDAARQYGLAAALQGNNPGAALRQASLGAAQVAGTTNQNADIDRANEQATARTALANTLTNVRSGDQGAVNTDVSQQNNLTGQQVTSQGQGVTSTGQKIAAKSAKYTADQVAKGAAIGAAGTLAAGLLSDKRAKKNIAKASLADALGKEVHGVTFTYKPEVEEDDDPHFGILADALGKVMPGVVKKGPSGFKEVDTGHLTLGNTAILAELARRLQDLEKGKGARRG